MRTSYLPQYNKKEPLWHLRDEPFDYTKVSEKKPNIPAKPTTRVLNRHYPNANNPPQETCGSERRQTSVDPGPELDRSRGL